ncbi:PilC/PilY family type IV pilus protein [Undibacterium cyanobacteriorum]|uniref:PilC/PilY family type IV pilus protein n=1 Tax=Undibacterium cyanobacteriorum TaxID=3073561 RepID=A0ABY9REX3_9BURK|nr:PilC/PilY family type IV pilus protein [Undibacterium sp. 20NA77.5]WMW79775.1 PilC/PilY family type IV pilus protein [Undibacterium sp. 20NA77.5]
MDSKVSVSKRVLAAALVLAQIILPLHANATVSKLPPLVKPKVPPNIMFTLDDSGSMLFEYLPDNLVPGFNYVAGFPQPASVYKNGDSFFQSVMGFGDNNGTDNALSLKIIRFRNWEVNEIYYNPNIRYEPWKNADGSSMAAANETAAYFNPVAPTGGSLVATINLTTDQQFNLWGTPTWVKSSTNASVAEKRNFYPATYFKYIGGTGCVSADDATSTACFQKVEIKSTTSTYPKMSSDRTDCVAAANTCSYQEEIKNFANWFQYWRSRMLMARGGVGTAFAKQESNLRVGFSAINAGSRTINGVSSDIVVAGVTPDFSGTNRQSFYDELYKYPTTSNGTPLRYAMDKVGRYFLRTDSGGPWQNTINDSASGQASCRQNYHIMMTDGTWNGNSASAPANGNVDGTNGSVMTAADGRTFQYKTTGSVSKDVKGVTTTASEKQYADSNSSTLADVAMYYWVTDLRTDWNTTKKNVPTNNSDPAFWQHLVTYTVGLGVVGTLDPKTDLPALTNGTKSWSTPASDSVNNVDDLWHAAVNGHGQYFSAKNPKQFGDSLASALADISSRVGSAAAVATSNNTLGSNTKLYTSSYRTDNWSGKLEQKSVNATTGAVAVTNDWDTDNWTVVPSTRKIYSTAATGTGGIEFKFPSLASTDQTIMNNAAAYYLPTVVTGTNIVDYIRGDKTLENNPFRIRKFVLGDLVNSDPQYVKEGKDWGYMFLPSGSVGKGSYQAFLKWKADSSRPATVYVGSNDGMLHAFDAAANDTIAIERFAYVPKSIIPKLPELAKKEYSHQFYVDGTTNIGDAAIGADTSAPWRMVLLGGTGAGGKAVFALDVTDPVNFSQSNVMWEYSSTLPAVDNDMGYTIGVPQMGRLKDGTWVAVFGNGYESASGKAVLYVVNLKTGAVLFKKDTGTTSNGLSTPKLLIGADSTIQAAYAGDLQGNLWKFDFVTASAGDPTVVNVAFSGLPLFTATNSFTGSAVRQAITTQPQLYPHPNNGVLVVFGTGKIYEDADVYTTARQTLYGIWDKGSASSVVAKTSLVEQTLSKDTSGTYYKIDNPQVVDWATKRGWFMDLKVTSGERLVTDPIIFEDQVIFTTLVPGTSSDPCITDGFSTTLQLSPLNGGPLSYKTIDTNGDGKVTADDTMYSGRQSTATMGTTIIRTGNRNLKVFQAASRDGTMIGGSDGVNSRASDPIPTVRLWRQINVKE